MKRERLVVGLTGMPGAGKSTAAAAARQLSCPVVVMGDFVRREALRRGLRITPEALGRLMLELRRARGKGVVAKMAVEAIKRIPSRVVVVDGVRSLAEVNEFRRHFPRFTLVAIHAPQPERFRRLAGRRRLDDSRDWLVFEKRDERELRVGVGEAIALADVVLQAKTAGELKKKMAEFLRHMGVAGSR